LAEQIDTGQDNELSRSLIVFNPSSVAVNGRAILPVDMPWRRSEPFPSVNVRELATGQIVQHEIDGVHWSSLGDTEVSVQTDKMRLRFLLIVCVEAVAANGYATYVAMFGDAVAETPRYDTSPCRPELIVVECRGHAGMLPCCGALVSTDDRYLVVSVSEQSSANLSVVGVTVANNARVAVIDKHLTFAAPVVRVVSMETGAAVTPLVDGTTLTLPRIGPSDALKLDVEISHS
jgi:hypothetical protein